MTEENNNQASVTTLPSPGEIIKQARDKAGLSIAELAKKVNLRVALIEEIEANQYDLKVSPTFSRGYLKLIAKNLELDEQQLLESYENLNLKPEVSDELQSFSKRTTREANDSRIMIVSYVIAIVLVALAVVWWLQQDSSPKPVKLVMPTEEAQSDTRSRTAQPEDNPILNEQPATGDEEAGSGAEQIEESIENGETPTETTTENQASEIDSEQVPPSEAGTPEPLSTDSDSQQSSELQTENTDADFEQAPESTDDELTSQEQQQSGDLNNVAVTEQPAEPIDYAEEDYRDMQFTFSRDCWVNLTDATGEAIAYGIKSDGYQMNVRGVPPIEVTLCSPEHVAVIFNGESIDMTQFRQGRTAKFNLPLVQD